MEIEPNPYAPPLITLPEPPSIDDLFVACVYRVTVIADRYGFASMDFETCAFESMQEAEAEAE